MLRSSLISIHPSLLTTALSFILRSFLRLASEQAQTTVTSTYLPVLALIMCASEGALGCDTLFLLVFLKALARSQGEGK